MKKEELLLSELVNHQDHQDKRMDIQSEKIDLLIELIRKVNDRLNLHSDQITKLYNHTIDICGLIDQIDSDKKES